MAFEGTVGLEGGGEIGRLVVGVRAFEVVLVVRAVVGGVDDESIVGDAEVLERLAQVAQVVIHAAHESGEAFLDIGPAVVDRGGVVRVTVGIDSASGGVDHLAGSAVPLHASLDAKAGNIEVVAAILSGVFDGGQLKRGVGSIVGEIEEKGLLVPVVDFISNQLFSASGEEVGGEAFVELVTHHGVLFVERCFSSGGGHVVGIMGMPVTVTYVTIEKVEATLGRIGWPGCGTLSFPL